MTKDSWIYGPWPLLALALGLALAGASAVSAETEGPKAANEAAGDVKRLVESIEGLGYRNVHDVEWDDGYWELEATSPKGLAVDLVVDPRSGEILHEAAD